MSRRGGVRNRAGERWWTVKLRQAKARPISFWTWAVPPPLPHDQPGRRCGAETAEGTPNGSEVDQFEVWFALADQLYRDVSRPGSGNWLHWSDYERWAGLFDSVPGVGEYYRFLCETRPKK